MTPSIESVYGREILDSRGNPTVEVEVTLLGGAVGAGGRAVGRLDRGARGGRAARRRQEALRRQGRPARPSRNVNEELAEAVVGLDALDQVGDRPDDARAGRHAEQGPPRRERDPGRLAGGGPGGGRAAVESAALPLPRRAERADAAGADDEHPQRRQARRGLQRRHAGVHGDAGRRADVPRGAALGHRGLPRAEEASCTTRAEHERRRRRRLRAEPGVEPGGARRHPRRRSSRPATSRARRSSSRSTRPRPSSSRTASTS